MDATELLLSLTTILTGCALAPNFRYGLYLACKPLARLLHIGAYLALFGPPVLLAALWFRLTRQPALWGHEMEDFLEARFGRAQDYLAPKGW